MKVDTNLKAKQISDGEPRRETSSAADPSIRALGGMLFADTKQESRLIQGYFLREYFFFPTIDDDDDHGGSISQILK